MKSNAISIDLPQPVQTESTPCLPHAAMGLGAPAQQAPEPIARLVLEPMAGAWMLYRLDADGGFVGDSAHADLADALHQVRREFGLDTSTWER